MKLLIRFVICSIVMAGAALAADSTVISPAGRKAMAPEIAIGSDGSLNVIWMERTPEGEKIAAAGAASQEGHTHLAETDLWFVRSTDGGKSFGAPVRVNGTPGAVWGFPVSKPRLNATPGGTLHVFFPGNSIDKKNGKPIVLPMYTRSTDGGRSFSAPVVLGAVAASDNSDIVHGGLANAECFGTMTTDGQGGVYTYWVDTRDMGKDSPNGKIFSAVSYDNGKSFGGDFEVFPADVCPCCQATAAVYDGRIYLGSRQVSAEGNRDSTVAISTDRGKSFQPRARWGGAHWKIEACPLKPTAIVVDGNYVYAAAYDGGANPQGAALSRSVDGGKTFEAAVPLQPGPAVSDAPVLALQEGRLVAVWHTKLAGERRVFLGVSRDHGKSFTAPVELGAGMYPVVANRAGGLQLAWQQGDSIVTRFIAGSDPLLR
ncbi:MAG: exo-alpha-sialidase [Gammaproteobacteria bacterium]|nr:MAG: exo-alpha-sialidase [Gammaproteobacteria bacterium]